jgi:hypothetical protein
MRGSWSGGGELVGSAGTRWRAADRATAAWARSVRETRPWAGVDGLVASGPNRRQVVLCSGPDSASFHNFNYFHSPKL